jgi:hypothetical protein
MVVIIFITNRGGTNKSSLKFVISSDYLKLIIDDDISLLDNITGYLSTNALKFFRLWYIHNHILEKDSYITSYVGYCKKLGKIKKESKDSIVDFVRKNFKMPCNVRRF